MAKQPPRHNPAQYLPRKGDPSPRLFGPGHLKLDRLLRDEDRDAYLALLRRPGITVDMAWEWLTEKGYRVGRGAVKSHKRKFDDYVKEVRRSAEISLACADLVRQVGVNRMSDAAVVRFEALLTETLFRKGPAGKAMTRRDWQTFGRALTHAVTNRTRVETIRLAAREARRELSRKGKANKPRRFDGAAISEKVRRILGVPLPGEPVPGLPSPGAGATGSLLPVPESQSSKHGPTLAGKPPVAPGASPPALSPPPSAAQGTSDSETPSPLPSPGGRGGTGAGPPECDGTPGCLPPSPPARGQG